MQSIHSNISAYYFMDVQKSHEFILPNTSDCYVIAYLREGRLVKNAGMSEQEFYGPSIITLAPSVQRSFRLTSAEINLDLLIFKEGFFLENQADIFYLLKFPFFENPLINAIAFQQPQSRTINTLFELISQRIKQPGLHEPAIIRSLIYGLLYEIEALHVLSGAKNLSKNITPPLYFKFKQLLYSAIFMQRSVGYYARELEVTPKHLSRVIRNTTGKNARAFIDEILIREAKLLLQDNELSISEVCRRLNFPDQSVFGKFFKAKTGHSPSAFRKT